MYDFEQLMDLLPQPGDPPPECYRPAIEALLKQHGIAVTKANTTKLWQCIWYSYNQIQCGCHATPALRATIEKRARSLMNVMKSAGLDLTAEFRAVELIVEIGQQPDERYRAHKVDEWDLDGIQSLFDFYCEQSGQRRPTLSLLKAKEGRRTIEQRTPPALRFMWQALRIMRESTTLNSVRMATQQIAV